MNNIRYPGSFPGAETEILKHMVHGKTIKQIASLMHLGERKVDAYRHRIFKRMGVTGIVGAVGFALKYRLFRPVRLVEFSFDKPLTNSQKEVLQYTAQGHDPKTIAGLMNISVGIVYCRTEVIGEKYGVTGTPLNFSVCLIHAAYLTHLVSPERTVTGRRRAQSP